MKVLFTIFLTIFFTVVGQLMTKKGMVAVGPMPSDKVAIFVFLIKNIFLNPYVFGGLLMAFFAAMSWMATLSKTDLGFAYPFMSLAFPLVLILSAVFFNEHISIQRWLGLGLIMVGLFVTARG